MTLLCETQRGYANLCRILTDAHAGTRVPGGEREPAARRDDASRSLAEHAEGLVCALRLRAARARRPSTRTPPRGSRARSAGAFYVELQRPYERGDARRNARARASSPRRSACRRSPPATCTRTTARACALQDALVAIRTARRSTAASASGAATTRRVLARPQEMLERLPRDAALRTREVADRCEFDLTQELGYRYPDFSDGADPRRRAAARDLRARVRRALRERERAQARARASGSTTSSR